jgi:membrane protein implicated in regulation of membrane protease activity
VAVWIIIAVLLVAIELATVSFFAIFAAAGAVAAAIVAAFAPGAYGVQIAVAAVVAGIGVVVVRPYVSRVFGHRGDGSTVGGVHGGLIGAQAMTLDEIAVHTPGHIRLLGETWLAVTHDGLTIAPGTPVNVTKVSGTTLTVKPAEEKESQ